MKQRPGLHCEENQNLPGRPLLPSSPPPNAQTQRGSSSGSMGSAKVNGIAAALKKRKRERNDDLKSQKKPKHQGVDEPEEVDNSELLDTRPLQSKQADELVFRTRGKIAAPQWRVSKPMGGRMLDIDPIFSLDEQ